MLDQGHRLKIGKVGIVGYVTHRGEPRIALDVGADAVHFENPLLPDTRSEMGLPLRLGERVIGALDVQSREEAAFSEGDVAVLQTMADQLAIAIENARLIREMEQTVRELEVAYGRHTQESWRAVSRTGRRTYGYRYRRLGVEPATEPPDEARQAWAQGRTVVGAGKMPAVQASAHPTPPPGEEKTIAKEGVDSEGDEREGIDTIGVPIKFRDQVIGVFSVRSATEPLPPEAVSLVEEVAGRLAIALENARLLEETQRSAERDRMIADITTQVRSSMDPETILQTAIRELGTALGADRTFVRLGSGSVPAEGDGGPDAQGAEGGMTTLSLGEQGGLVAPGMGEGE